MLLFNLCKVSVNKRKTNSFFDMSSLHQIPRFAVPYIPKDSHKNHTSKILTDP